MERKKKKGKGEDEGNYRSTGERADEEGEG
jgi:hypothetical protein